MKKTPHEPGAQQSKAGIYSFKAVFLWFCYMFALGRLWIGYELSHQPPLRELIGGVFSVLYGGSIQHTTINGAGNSGSSSAERADA